MAVLIDVRLLKLGIQSLICHAVVGPERLGGRGNIIAKVEAEAQRTGEDINTLGVKVCTCVVWQVIF